MDSAIKNEGDFGPEFPFKTTFSELAHGLYPQSMRQIQKSRLKVDFSFSALGSLRVLFESHSQWWAILENGFVSMAR